MSDTCKNRVYDKWGSHRCTRKAIRDDYCKQHHPEAVEARKVAAQKRHEEAQRKSPWFLLREVMEENARLKSKLRVLCNLLSEVLRTALFSEQDRGKIVEALSQARKENSDKEYQREKERWMEDDDAD